MTGGESYLDLAFLINGSMDAFLLMLTGRLLHYPTRINRILGGALIGEIPVILSCFDLAPWLTISKFTVPLLMVGLTFWPCGVRRCLKILAGFWLLSAALGGLVYAFWDWAQFEGVLEGKTFALAATNVWLLPLAAGLWWLGQKGWQRWQARTAILEQTVFELEIDFGKEDQIVRVKALLDTGNQLHDPLTGAPVLLLEETVALAAMPENLRSFLELPWRESNDPWPFLWKVDPQVVKSVVFVPFRSIDRQSWLIGIRPRRVTIFAEGQSREVEGTVALIQQVLSSEGEYQALLHPEQTRKRGDYGHATAATK